MGNNRSKIRRRQWPPVEKILFSRKAALRSNGNENPCEGYFAQLQPCYTLSNSREIKLGEIKLGELPNKNSLSSIPDEVFYEPVDLSTDEHEYSVCEDNCTVYEVCASIANTDCSPRKEDDYLREARYKSIEIRPKEQLYNVEQELQESSYSLNESASTHCSESLSELTCIEVDEHNIDLLADLIMSRPTAQCLRISRIEEAASVPEDIVRLKSLQVLEFSECNFKDHQRFAEVETCLMELHIAGTLLTPPPIISELTTLRKLILKGCQFEALPGDIGELCQLEVLDISFNKYLDNLPTSMEFMAKLTVLRLCHCAFEEVPAVIGQLNSLQFIDLSSNRLQSFPDVTLRLMQLTSLDLSNTPDQEDGNNIEQIPVQILDSTLKHLNIANNPVVIPPKEICVKGFAAMRDYLSNVRGGDGLYADTIIVLGEPKAGKSTVAKSLAAKRSRQATKKSRSQVLDQLIIAVEHQRLVNLYDFGGDEVSREIIPVLSPRDGLMLLVYDMSKEPKSDFEKGKGAGSLDDVQKWLTELLMRSSGARIIVVGTHLDAVEKQKRKRLEHLMKNHVLNVMRSVETVILKQKASLEVCSNSTFSKGNIEKLNTRLEAVRKADIIVVTLSCSHDNDTGIDRLMCVISNKLRPSKPLIDSFSFIITDILSYKFDDVDLLFLKWEQIKVIYGRHIYNDESDEEIDNVIKNILRYLCDTCQIIWIEGQRNNKRLSRYVFHQPALIARICESLLRLNWKNDNSSCLELFTRSCLSESRDGYLRECDLHFFLRKYLPFLGRQQRDTLNVLVELMMHFHIISEVAEEPCGRIFVNPRYFVEDPPADQIALTEKPFMPRIHIQLRFIGSCAHRTYPAENVVELLTWAHSRNVLPVVWKTGVFFKDHGVYVLVTQEREVMDLICSVNSEKDDMWNILIPLIQYMSNTMFAARNDTPPYATVQCPGCRCCGQHPAATGCTERGRTTLYNLSRPLDVCPTVWRFCPDCKKDIPTCLIYPCYLENYTKEKQEAVAKFVADLRGTCKQYSPAIACAATKIDTEVKHCSSEVFKNTVSEEELFEYLAPTTAQPSDIVRKIRAFRPYLIDALTIDDVRYLVDELYSKYLISRGQKEQIEAGADNGSRPIAVRRLLDAIENRGQEAGTTFISALQSDKIDRRDLVEQLHKASVP